MSNKNKNVTDNTIEQESENYSNTPSRSQLRQMFVDKDKKGLSGYTKDDLHDVKPTGGRFFTNNYSVFKYPDSKVYYDGDPFGDSELNQYIQSYEATDRIVFDYTQTISVNVNNLELIELIQRAQKDGYKVMITSIGGILFALIGNKSNRPQLYSSNSSSPTFNPYIAFFKLDFINELHNNDLDAIPFCDFTTLIGEVDQIYDVKGPVNYQDSYDLTRQFKGGNLKQQIAKLKNGNYSIFTIINYINDDTHTFICTESKNGALITFYIDNPKQDTQQILCEVPDSFNVFRLLNLKTVILLVIMLNGVYCQTQQTNNNLQYIFNNFDVQTGQFYNGVPVSYYDCTDFNCILCGTEPCQQASSKYNNSFTNGPKYLDLSPADLSTSIPSVCTSIPVSNSEAAICDDKICKRKFTTKHKLGLNTASSACFGITRDGDFQKRVELTFDSVLDTIDLGERYLTNTDPYESETLQRDNCASQSNNGFTLPADRYSFTMGKTAGSNVFPWIPKDMCTIYRLTTRYDKEVYKINGYKRILQMSLKDHLTGKVIVESWDGLSVKKLVNGDTEVYLTLNDQRTLPDLTKYKLYVHNERYALVEGFNEKSKYDPLKFGFTQKNGANINGPELTLIRAMSNYVPVNLESLTAALYTSVKFGPAPLVNLAEVTNRAWVSARPRETFIAQSTEYCLDTNGNTKNHVWNMITGTSSTGWVSLKTQIDTVNMLFVRKDTLGNCVGTRDSYCLYSVSPNSIGICYFNPSNHTMTVYTLAGSVVSNNNAIQIWNTDGSIIYDMTTWGTNNTIASFEQFTDPPVNLVSPANSLVADVIVHSTDAYNATSNKLACPIFDGVMKQRGLGIELEIQSHCGAGALTISSDPINVIQTFTHSWSTLNNKLFITPKKQSESYSFHLIITGKEAIQIRISVTGTGITDPSCNWWCMFIKWLKSLFNLDKQIMNNHDILSVILNIVSVVSFTFIIILLGSMLVSNIYYYLGASIVKALCMIPFIGGIFLLGRPVLIMITMYTYSILAMPYYLFVWFIMGFIYGDKHYKFKNIWYMNKLDMFDLAHEKRKFE